MNDQRVINGIALAPVDAVAARVTQKGVHHVYASGKLPPGHSEIPLPFKRPDADRLRQPLFTDFTGKRFGRFEVMGLFVEHKDKARWVVRCACGRYEVRGSRAVKNPQNTEDCCEKCRKVQQSKRHHDWWVSQKVRHLCTQE